MPQARPAKRSVMWSGIGGTPLCCIVIRLRGSSECTIRSFPSFLSTQNQRERYEALEGSYTPEAIFLRMISSTSL